MGNIERKHTEQPVIEADRPLYLCAGFSVEGDCRFLSHHDTMRLVELAVFRAAIPVGFSGGFNPRPKLSLPLPRPVGMASRDELLVLRMAEPLDGERLVERMNDQCPGQVRFLWSRPLAGKKVEILSADHEATLDGEQTSAVGDAMADLARRGQWTVERDKGREGKTAVDIKPMVSELRVQDDRLAFRLHNLGGRWAKPMEVFELLGLNGRTMTARTVRTSVEREMQFAGD